jgi:hypothetical protein
MANKAQVELRIQNDEPTVKIVVPKGTSLDDIAKIQANLFAHPERLGEPFRPVLGSCPTCLSGIQIEMVEAPVQPVVRDIQDMFTHLSTEMRSINTRLSSLERGGARSDLVPSEGAVTARGVIEY